ncbi:MAG: hypothetical protein KGL53_02265, partial [Elusimicrobia bacterium]|nr:hypothetical protein [Elusimicrobiota bacterium]
MALIVLLVALPTGVYLYQYIQTAMKGAVAERHQKVATQLANDALTDYFRQFSQDAYKGHYDTASLSRPESFYSAGFSTATFIADDAHHSLYIRAEGGYGTAAAPKTLRVLEALIAFQSDLVRFGTMFNGAATISASNVTYDGGFYANGNLSITGSNVTFEGGPVVVNGNISGTTTIDGDVFYTGSLGSKVK